MFYQSFVILLAFYPIVLTVSCKSSIHFLPRIIGGEADARGGITFCLRSFVLYALQYPSVITQRGSLDVGIFISELSVLRFRPLIALLLLGGEAIEVYIFVIFANKLN